jgi:hypothetical protein
MALNTAIRHLQRGDWQKAHAIVQNDATEMGCWAHGIVHMLEGDVGNARYWYRRAGRPFPRERDASAEIDALVATLKQQAAAASEAAKQQTADNDRPAASKPRATAAERGRAAKQQAASTEPAPTKQHR